jgi:hypothetical protein
MAIAIQEMIFLVELVVVNGLNAHDKPAIGVSPALTRMELL